MAITHCVIPDVQHKAGLSTDFLTHIGHYIVEHKPDVVIQIGDFADMPSLSSYDIGKKSFEGRRYKSDIEATHQAMSALLKPIAEFNLKQKKNKEKQYKPQMVLTLGNHENRIERVVESDPKLEGTIGIEDLKYEDFGWTVVPYLQPIVLDGVAYSHYFTSGVAGRPVASAPLLLHKKHMSCVAGHQQGLLFHTDYRADGKRITSIIAGSCYEHDEAYLGAQGNRHWRGIIQLNEVCDGEFDIMPVTLKYLRAKYA